jgi:hypothetical protein
MQLYVIVFIVDMCHIIFYLQQTNTEVKYEDITKHTFSGDHIICVEKAKSIG